MGLAPEFFILIGIDLFLGTSVISALLDRNLPSMFQYLLQVAGLLGLAQLFLGAGFLGNVVRGDPSGQLRFWLSAVYLGAAVVCVTGLNVYLAVVKRRLEVAATLTGTVTVPAAIVSLFLVYSYASAGGDVAFSPATAVIIAVAALVSGFSVLGFLRQALRHTMAGSRGNSDAHIEPKRVRVDPISTTVVENEGKTSPSGTMPTIGEFSFSLPALQEKDQWEELSKSSSNDVEKE